MKFQNVAESFNYYRAQSVEAMQQRAQQIKAEIDTNPEADIDSLNIELKGIAQAKANAESRSEARKALKLFESSDQAGKTFERDTVLESPEYRSAFLKTMLNQKLNDVETRAFNVATETRADAYNTTSNSGAVLPTTTLNEVLKKARAMGGLLGECRSFAMPTGISIPIATPSGKAAWHVESAAVDSENVSIAPVTFGGYELMKVFSISEKVRRMSIGAFESYLIDELNDCIMETLDYAIVNGSGSGQATGLESGITWATTGDNANAIEVAAAKDIAYENVVAALALLKRGYSDGAKFAMSNSTLYRVFYGMVDSNKRPIFIADAQGDTVGRILGKDIIIDDNIADDVVYLGNFSKYYGVNLPEGITIESSRESSFKRGVIDYRAMAIADAKPLIAEAFVKLYKATA